MLGVTRLAYHPPMLWAIFLKKTIALLALVQPFGLIPLFMEATRGQQPEQRRKFARLLAVTVTVALAFAGMFGTQFMGLMGLTLGGMRVGGGIIILIVAIAMVLGKEQVVKRTRNDAASAAAQEGRGIVPLGIPLLAGPGALSYMMSHGPVQEAADVVLALAPAVAIGLISWATFYGAARALVWLTPARLNVIERIFGFLLAGLAIDMMAMGLKQLFPLLAG